MRRQGMSIQEITKKMEVSIATISIALPHLNYLKKSCPAGDPVGHFYSYKL